MENKNKNRNSSIFFPSVQTVSWQGFASIYEVREEDLIVYHSIWY